MSPFPNPANFARLLRSGYAVPLALEVAADTETPVSAFLKLADGARQAFLFESVEGGERVARWSFLGVRPKSILRWHIGARGDPLEKLERALAKVRPAPITGLPPFSGGHVGMLSYDAVRLFEPRVPCTHADELGFPDALWMNFDTVVAFDHVRRCAQIVTWTNPSPAVSGARAYARALRRLQSVARRLRSQLPRRERVTCAPGKLRPRINKADFLRSVAKAKEAISAGDCQQIVLSQRFETTVGVSPFALYRALRRVNPSPYLFFVRDGPRALIGSSPETLVRLRGNDIAVRPIAGTRRRGANPHQDVALEAELLGDPKENAEHTMLVDLGRNDVGRVSAIGSVQVVTLKKIERYSHVMHMVSEIQGRLAPKRSALDVLRATFPAGTLTGSPKVRAMELIDALEATRRGPYGGCVGYIDHFGDMDMAIAIRTLLQNGRHVSVQAGAGIVWDSVPKAEYEESVNKARALFVAIEAAHAGTQEPR